MILFMSTPGITWAYDNYYLFKQGNVARDEGNLSEAIQYYQEYITTHPLIVETGFSGNIPRNGQYFLRNLLMACDNLCDLLRQSGRSNEIDYWLNKLKTSYQPENYGSKNTYNLARILQANNYQDDAIVFLEKIIAVQKDEYRPGNNKVFLRAAASLIDIYKKRGESAMQVQLFQNLLQFQTTDFDHKDKYKLATLYLENEQTRKEGEQILAGLIKQAAEV